MLRFGLLPASKLFRPQVHLTALWGLQPAALTDPCSGFSNEIKGLSSLLLPLSALTLPAIAQNPWQISRVLPANLLTSQIV